MPIATWQAKRRFGLANGQNEIRVFAASILFVANTRFSQGCRNLLRISKLRRSRFSLAVMRLRKDYIRIAKRILLHRKTIAFALQGHSFCSPKRLLSHPCPKNSRCSRHFFDAATALVPRLCELFLNFSRRKNFPPIYFFAETAGKVSPPYADKHDGANVRQGFSPCTHLHVRPSLTCRRAEACSARLQATISSRECRW